MKRLTCLLSCGIWAGCACSSNQGKAKAGIGAGDADDAADAADAADVTNDVPGTTDSGDAAVEGVPCVHTTTDSIFRHDTDTLPSGPCVVDPNEPVCKLIVRECPCINYQASRQFYSC